ISDADLDLLKAVEDVEFGERQALNAAGAHGLTHQNCAEPAAAPRPSGDDAEFLAALAERFADLIGLFGRKRSRADAGRVGLADAKDVVDCARAPTRTGRRWRRRRVGGRDERIGPMVDVEQRALRAFK